MARSSDDLTLKVGFDIDKFIAELRRTNSTLNSWASGVQKSLAGLAAGFSGLSLGRFILDISKLAGEAEGVKEAFDKLPSSIQLMNDLKKATSGTVSELDLMKRSVMASNFDISLKALPQLLEFATLRAKQTGQSVDYLVDSIVTGIGRKSKLILDNLGISAVQLTEALGGASAASSTIGEVAEAVGKIASKNLETMGSLSENASTKLDRLSASWENLKVAVGKASNGTGVLGNEVQRLTETFTILASENLSYEEKLSALIGTEKMSVLLKKDAAFSTQKAADETIRLNDAIETAKYVMQLYDNDIVKIKEHLKGASDATAVLVQVGKLLTEQEKAAASTIRNEKNLTAELTLLREEGSLAIGAEKAAINLKVKAIEAEIEALNKLGEAQESVNPFKAIIGAKNTPTGLDALQVGQVGKTGKETLTGADAQFDKTFEHISDLLTKAKSENEQYVASWQQTQANIIRSAAMIGDSVGQSLGGMISGTESFADSMRQMARDVIAQLERVALAYIVTNAAKMGNPVLVAAAATIGFGLVKGLFNSIGGDSQGSGGMRMNGREQDFARQWSGTGGKVEFVIQGNKLVGVLDNQNRFHRRTGT